MINWLIKKYTKGYTEVPLFWVNFDLIKYNQFGKKVLAMLIFIQN